MKRLLIVVDYQNDFVDGALGFPGAELLEGPIVQKIQAYRDRLDEIVFTLDTHRRGYLKTHEGRNLPVQHCMEGTSGHELYGAVAALVRPSDMVFRKSAFGSADLFEWLRVAQKAAAELDKPPFESIELVGLMSSICVLSNAVLAQAACPEVPLIVDAACTASFDPDLHEKTLDVMEGLQMQVINR